MRIALLAQITATLATLLLAGAPGWSAGGPLAAADKKLHAGQYAAAERAYRALGSDAARLGLARVLVATGRLAEAQRTARRAARGKQRDAALTLVGETQRLAGDYAAARKTLEQVVARNANAHRARAYLGLVYHETGERALARATFERFYDDYAAGAIDKRSAVQLTYVAMACRYTDNFRDASDTFADAVKADPKHLEAHVQWAEISLEKYEAGWAEKHYDDALKINPHHVATLTGLARVKLEQSNDVRAAEALLERALQTNPQSIEARVIRARMLIDNERHAAAEKTLAEALKRNPHHLAALTMLAASQFLRDDLAAYRQTKKRVFRLNAHHTLFFHRIVELAVRQHRYADAIRLSQEAIRIDPEDWYSLADLGTNYLRLGDDDTGLKYLRQAWRGDQFNVRNYNLLNLYEDVIAKEYTFVRSRHFRVRVHRAEQALIERVVLPLLEQAYASYVKRYRFRPSQPITVELFRDPKHYAIRTVGLPALAALAVCFGPVITTTSPTLGRFNWGQVLWHELNHVFTIQLSRSRVPRWLTEGLADMEPALHNPAWKRENDFDIFKALRSGRLHGLGSMNAAFARARSIGEMVVAYYQGSLMASYLVQGWGLPKVIDLLRQYGKGKRTAQILPAATGLSLAQLDSRFRTAQLKRLAHYNKSWYVDWQAYEDLDARRQAAEASPQDARAQAALALALLVAGQAQTAARAAKQALARDAKQRQALFVQARLALKAGRAAEARQHLRALIAAGGDGYPARLALGRLALSQNDLKQAAAELARAKAFDPERSEPAMLLAGAYRKAKQQDRLIDELKQLARLEQQHFGPVWQLVELLAARKDHAGVRHFGEMAHWIQPAAPRLQLLLAEAYRAAAPRPRLDRAIWHLQTALSGKPEDKRIVGQIEAQLAQIYLDRRDLKRARQHFRAARKAAPDLPALGQIEAALGNERPK